MAKKRGRKPLQHPLITADSGKDAIRIKMILLQANKTQQQIAEELGISYKLVNRAVNRRENSRTVLDHILALRNRAS
jgi:DNA-binding transcriptional regulator LsrR (DeoR family)